MKDWSIEIMWTELDGASKRRLDFGKVEFFETEAEAYRRMSAINAGRVRFSNAQGDLEAFGPYKRSGKSSGVG